MFVCSICEREFASAYSLGSHAGHHTSGYRKHPLKVSSEIRACECDCGETFECRVTSNRRYIHGHNRKGKKTVLRETRFCKCNCGESFECLATSTKRYMHGHGKRILKETRFCECDCGGTFICSINSKQRFLVGHGSRGTKRYRLPRFPLLALVVEEMMSEKRESPFCACDCGERVIVLPHHRNRGIPRYLPGHHRKRAVSEKKGRTYIEMYGEVRAEEISRTQGSPGDSNPAKRPEAREKIRIAKLLYHQEHPGIMKGENSGTWKGGITNAPYPFEFSGDLKEFIRERANYVCQLCSKIDSYQNRSLSVHHIDYVKENIHPDNLVALCGKCHTKTNHNREYWTNFFQLQIKEGVLV